ncbi:unnamed protein product [Caenorhabditis brenneri]
MTEADDFQKFKKYCSQLEKYGQSESVHSPSMAMLRRKARKQLIALMKHSSDCTSNINKLWIVGYYHPFQYYIRENDNAMETTTLLTMFCGELQEMLMLSNQRYYSLWNLYIGDLHRYMPDDELQKTLAVGFYSRAIELDRRQGRAFHVLATLGRGLSLAEKLRLMILGQIAEIPHKKSSELVDFLKLNGADENIGGSEKFLIEFVNWAWKDAKSVDHQLLGLKLGNDFKTIVDNDTINDLPMIMSVCRCAGVFVFKNYGYTQFQNCFDVVSNFYLTIFSKASINRSLLPEAISWITDAGSIFGSLDSTKNEFHYQSLSIFMKTKWNELNDSIMECINKQFKSEPFEVAPSPNEDIGFLINGPKSSPSKELLGSLVNKLIEISHPTVQLNQANSITSGPLLSRINQTVQKRLDIPLESLSLKENTSDREDWRPVYVMMDFDTLVDNIRIARKVWDIDDFICVLPSSVLDQLDKEKTKNRAVRPIIRSLMELQAEGKMVLRKCNNDRHCAEQLVKSAKRSSNDHKNIVAFLCKNSEDQEAMEGVTFYDIHQFYKKYLE